jgi:hypothetical protein
MRRLLLCLIALAALFTLTPAVQAQSTPDTTLADLLRYIPDTPETREEGMLSYLDMNAMLAAKGLTADEVRTALTNDPNSIVIGRFNRGVLSAISSGSLDLLQAYFTPADMIAVTGIDPLSIDRFMNYSAPPALATVMQGTFDPQQAQAAFLKNEYQVVAQDVSDKGVLLCSVDGCDIGRKVNLQKRNRNNPFGGVLGQQPPLFVAPDLALYSRDEPLIRDMISQYAGKPPATKSLADAPEVRALTNALNPTGTLLQAYFVPIKYMASYVSPPIRRNAPTMTPDPNFKAIPEYLVFAAVHSQTQTGQAVTLAFVFPNRADAESAAAIMTERLKTYQSIAVRRPFASLIEERGGTLADPIIVPGETATSPVTLLLRFDTPPEDVNDSDKAGQGALLYRLFVNALQQRDILWFALGKP